jgi:hypothetical protein
MDVMLLKQSDLAALEPAENTTDITLGWETDLSIEDHVLPIVKRWRHLKRLTFMESVQINVSVRSLKVICDFIMGMKHLSYLHIAPDYDYDGKLKVLRDKVNEFILPRRPNFKFDITLFLD